MCTLLPILYLFHHWDHPFFLSHIFHGLWFIYSFIQTFNNNWCWVLGMQRWITWFLLSRYVYVCRYVVCDVGVGGGGLMHKKITVMLCYKWDILEMEKFSEHQTEGHSNISTRKIKRTTKKMTIKLVLEEWICFLSREKVKGKRSFKSTWAKTWRCEGVWDLGYCLGYCDMTLCQIYR